MRCSLAIATFVLLGQLVLAQQNLVVNGSFENPPNCPSASVSFAASAMGWVSGTEVGTPDHFHTCVTIDPLAVPCNWRGCQEPRTGDGYAGIWAFSKYHPEAREYIQTQLIQPLYPGVRYEVRFYVSLAEHMGGYAVSTMGAALTAESPDTLDGGLRLNADPQVLYQGPPLTDTINWILITDTIVSRGDNERFLTIGNFFADGDSDTLLFNPNAQLSELAYYFIDDVSVVALDSVPSGVGIDEVERERAFNVYPNPNNGQFTLAYDLKGLENGEVRVYDMVGKQVFTQTLIGEAGTAEMNLVELNAGVYLISLEVNGVSRFTERLSILSE